MDAQPLYAHRFDAAERAAKARVWEVLCTDFFQRWVRPTDAVLDLGAGFCEFINHIQCAGKYAVDANPEIAQLAGRDVVTHCGPAHELGWIGHPVDVVFTSNFFEHMLDKTMLLDTLRAVHGALRRGGRLLILQPNIRYAYREYWDFLDHHIPLSHLSMVEALVLTGFNPTDVRPRFLPWTTKSYYPQWPILVRVYLRCPPLQWWFGKQMFIAAEKK